MEGRSSGPTLPEAMSSGSLRLLRNALESLENGRNALVRNTVLPGNVEDTVVDPNDIHVSPIATNNDQTQGTAALQESGTEWPSRFDGGMLILDKRSRSKGEGPICKSKDTKRTLRDRLRNSVNTLDAISDILLDKSERSSRIAHSMNDVDSVQDIAKPVEQKIERVTKVRSLDLLLASSKFVESNSVGFEGNRLKKSPQEVDQKANGMNGALKEECYKVVEAPEAMKDEEPIEAAQQEQREVKVILEGDVEKTFFLSAGLNVHQAKEVLGRKLKVIPRNIILKATGRILWEKDVLENVGDITMELYSDETLCDAQGQQTLGPKVVQVKILQQDGTWKYNRVAMVNVDSRKQYLGGYRDKRTGQVYYHVVCQTEPRKRSEKSVTREVQANLSTVDFGVNTMRTIPTQTSEGLSGHFKVLSARSYIPYNEIHKTMVPHRAAQIIQKAWRRYLFCNFIAKYFKKLADSLQDRAKGRSNALEVVQKRRVQTLTAAIFPSFRSHFTDTLGYFHLWATTEAKRLANTKQGFARKAAMAELLRQEQTILFVLETQRLKAVEENLRKQEIMFLEGTAQSRARIFEKGNVTLINDLNIQKAGVLKEIFASYSRTDTTPAERLDILNGMRSSLLRELPNHPDAMELLEILAREIDLITMGFPSGQMKYLRKRFETLFLHLCHDPEVNHQAKYYRKTHITEKKYAIRRCKLCNKNLPSSLMFKHVRMNKFTLCMSCAQLGQNVATHQVNLAPYKRMLLALRQRELEKCCRSSIPFLLQPLGAFFLVNVIWNGKSIWSGNNDVTQLRMARWLPHQDWSVWNMVLLTEKEVAEHERIPDPLSHYPQDYILQVRTKNILGRMNFMYLVDIDKDFKFDRTSSMGKLPRDHLLYTNNHHAKYAPANTVPEFFKPALRATVKKEKWK